MACSVRKKLTLKSKRITYLIFKLLPLVHNKTILGRFLSLRPVNFDKFATIVTHRARGKISAAAKATDLMATRSNDAINGIIATYNALTIR